MNNLTTGTNCGLGKYLLEERGGASYTRENQGNQDLFLSEFTSITHCAFNSHVKTDSNNLSQLLNDNILLTQSLAKIKCKKFIYISSIDVYHKTDNKIHHENENIALKSNLTLYQIEKLISETIVKKYCKNYLILRPGLLLGKYMRHNNLLSLLMEKKPILSLTKNSTFNCVRYEDILAFINLAIQQDMTGTYNIVSNNSIALDELANAYNKTAQFGSYDYQSGQISNKKINEICGFFNKNSIDVVNDFLGKNHEN